jgi:hypothetical protein
MPPKKGQWKRPEVPLSARNKTGRILYGRKTGVFIDNEKYPLDWAACGSRANFKAHIRRGQEPCRACRLAESTRLAANGERWLELQTESVSLWWEKLPEFPDVRS